MTDSLDTLNLSRHDVITIALALSASASSAYSDDRLGTAAGQHHLAARFWFAAGYDRKASKHHHLANAITQVIADINAGEEEEVQ